jgi:DNA polymerase delta subunit 1
MISIKPYDWFVDEDEDSTIINIAGLSNEPIDSNKPEVKKKVLVRVSGFKPYCYVELPNNILWTKQRLNNVSNEITRKSFPGKPVSISFERRKKLYGYKDYSDRDSLYPFLFVRYKSTELCRRLYYRLKNPIQVYGFRNKLKFNVHEHNTNALIKFTAWSRLPLSDWIDVELTKSTTLFVNGKYVDGPLVKEAGPDGIVSSKPDALSTSHIEVWTDYRGVKKSASDYGMTLPTVLSFDIECYSSRHIINPMAMPKGTIREDKIIQICMILQTPDGKVSKYLLALDGKHGSCGKIPGVHVINTSSEDGLLRLWTNFVMKKNVDILIGYNIHGFDFRYLADRANLLGCWNQFCLLSRVINRRCIFKEMGMPSKGKKVKSEYHTSSFIEIPTRISFDLMGLIKRDNKLPNYKLSDVVEPILGPGAMGKIDLPAKRLFELWDEGTKDALTQLGEYCVQDGVVVLNLYNKLNAWINLVQMSNVTYTPMQDIFLRGQGIKILCQLYREILEDRRVQDFVPKKGYGDYGGDGDVDEEDKYAGAIVLDPVKGRYCMIPVNDFVSLYPTIMISNNICYTTLVKDDSVPDEDCYICEWEDHINCEHDPNKTKNKKRKKMCGVKRHRFYRHEQGLLPRLLTRLLTERKKVKDFLEIEKDAVKRSVFNGQQLALKIAANAIYGSLGNKVGYLPLPEGAESVTAIGRKMINMSKEYTESNYDARVIYGDTDSIFIKFYTMRGLNVNDIGGIFDPSKEPNANEAILLGKQVAKEITEKLFTKPVTLAFEKLFGDLIIFKKKNYSGNIIDSSGKELSVTYKGITPVRTDRPPFIRGVYKSLLTHALHGESQGVFVDTLATCIYRLMCGLMHIDELIIAKTIRGSYKKKPAHMILAEMMIERGIDVKPGDKVQYILMNIGVEKANQEDMIEDPNFYLMNQREMAINYTYYITNQVVPTIDELSYLCYGVLLATSVYNTFRKHKIVMDSLKFVFAKSKGLPFKRPPLLVVR